MNSTFPCLICMFLAVMTGCDSNETDRQQAVGAAATDKSSTLGCLRCHERMQLDANHDLLCTTCHRGHLTAVNQDKAHQGLVARPAHPDHMHETCGSCHPKQTSTLPQASHYTLAGEIDLVRQHFGLSHGETITTLPLPEEIENEEDLVNDLLRRRCLRCHLFAPGDTYSKVYHGTGCAACHLAFSEQALVRHDFILPGAEQCLSCHYGNFVGMDFFGHYEHDYGVEYRTPYRSTPSRPYGLEQHDLAPDLHQQAGLTCLDCHQDGLHGEASSDLTCRSCHDRESQPPAELALQDDGSSRTLLGRDGRQHTIPLLSDPAHDRYGSRVGCQVCHGQWSVDDSPTHLMRSEYDDYIPWSDLIVQGSSELEQRLSHNIFSDEDELPMAMTDSVSGRSMPGIWFKGYGQRRWETMPIGRDAQGMLQVMRPLLDLRLSQVNEDGEAEFDNLVGSGQTLLPYTPHTTGHAGRFYLDRFRNLLPPTDTPQQ